MPLSALIFTAVLIHLGTFVCYPESGRMGMTFLFISPLMWTGLAIFTANAVSSWNRGNRIIFAVFFLLACLFSALTLMPQKDGRSPYTKFLYSEYPKGESVYVGLLRLGIYAPSLRPPPPPTENP
ncbi:MAG: hypothetical protein M0011_05155 [Elusimicrobia bacterium]|nr:hypothetical protein [Elusimicrobiota bacterium]